MIQLLLIRSISQLMSDNISYSDSLVIFYTLLVCQICNSVPNNDYNVECGDPIITESPETTTFDMMTR